MPTIQSIDICATARCNAACPFCYGAQAREPSKSQDMDDATVEAAWQWFAKHGCKGKKKVRWLGSGEPSLRWEWVLDQTERAREVLGQSTHFVVWTNGAILPDDVLERIRALRMNLCMSIEGHDGDTTWRGLPTHTVRAHAQKIVAAGYRTARGTIGPEHAGEYAEVAQDLYSLGFRWIQLDFAVDQSWTDDHRAALRQGITEAANWYSVAKRTDPDLTFFNLDRSLKPVKPGGLSCAAGNSMVGVDVDGRFLPCHRYAGHPLAPDMGNVFDGLDAAPAQALNQPYTCPRQCEGYAGCMLYCPWKRHVTAGDANAALPPEWCSVFQHLRAEASRAREASKPKPRPNRVAEHRVVIYGQASHRARWNRIIESYLRGCDWRVDRIPRVTHAVDRDLGRMFEVEPKPDACLIWDEHMVQHRSKRWNRMRAWHEKHSIPLFAVDFAYLGHYDGLMLDRYDPRGRSQIGQDWPKSRRDLFALGVH